jgi:hypothetical protein
MLAKISPEINWPWFKYSMDSFLSKRDGTKISYILMNFQNLKIFVQLRWGGDRMTVGFTTICAISAYPAKVVSSNPFMARCTLYNIMS